MNILQFLQKLAFLLAPWKQFFLLLSMVFVIAVISSFFVFATGDENIIAVPALLAFLWSLMFYIHTSVFAPSKQEIDTKKSLMQGLKARIKRFLLMLFALIFILLTVVSVVASIRILSVWFG